MNTPTPNTPANAGNADITSITRVAANMLVGVHDYDHNIAVIRAAIDKAIERYRAERDAAPNVQQLMKEHSQLTIEHTLLQAKLAERDAELTRLREELGKSIDRELVQAKTIAERSAALDVCKMALNGCKQTLHFALHEVDYESPAEEHRAHGPLLASWGEVHHALAQIEALAGGKTGIGLVDGKVTRFKMPDMGGPDLNEEGDK